MRRVLSFDCEGAALAATLDRADGRTGLLIVSGGNEIRIGAHRGMARLAADVAASGHPVFRFDRRGVGDSEGINGGFESAAPDIAAALTAFRTECPAVRRIVAFGNCDAATALLVHRLQRIDALVLGNPWAVETEAELPAPAAIRARYAEKLLDPREWLRLASGAVDLKKLARGLRSLTRFPATSELTERLAGGMTSFSGPITFVLADRDPTALAFRAVWAGNIFDTIRIRPDLTVVHLDSAAHSFASDADYAALKSSILGALAG